MLIYFYSIKQSHVENEGKFYFKKETEREERKTSRQNKHTQSFVTKNYKAHKVEELAL